MENLKSLLKELITEKKIIKGSLSNLRNKEPNGYTKTEIKPVLLKNELYYQIAYHYSNKVIHENYTEEDAYTKILDLFTTHFKQGLLFTENIEYQILISKKFKVTILKKEKKTEKINLSHNRSKNYLLQEGTPIPFLIHLGVMNTEGKVLTKKYDKFKQINRFLEMVEDIIPYLKKEKKLKIIDFGCGKSYLTFALYHHLVENHGLDIDVIGLDLKEEVIEYCNTLAKKLNFNQLHFYKGDIANYKEATSVDLVVTLHACNTATDAALEKAIRWNADVILSVPCCQHELFKQINNEILSPLLDHGILKERFSALTTDAIRANLLEILGYKTQILEFIDLEHTPKNLLIRAVKQKGENNKNQFIQSYLDLKAFLHIDPYLERILSDVLHPLLEQYKK